MSRCWRGDFLTGIDVPAGKTAKFLETRASGSPAVELWGVLASAMKRTLALASLVAAVVAVVLGGEVARLDPGVGEQGAIASLPAVRGENGNQGGFEAAFGEAPP